MTKKEEKQQKQPAGHAYLSNVVKVIEKLGNNLERKRIHKADKPSQEYRLDK